MKEAQWTDVRIKIMINNLYISMNEEKNKRAAGVRQPCLEIVKSYLKVPL